MPELNEHVPTKDNYNTVSRGAKARTWGEKDHYEYADRLTGRPYSCAPLTAGFIELFGTSIYGVKDGKDEAKQDYEPNVHSG